MFVDAAPQRHESGHSSDDVAAWRDEARRHVERAIRSIEMLDDVEETRDVERPFVQIGHLGPQVTAEKPRARRSRGRDVDERAMTVDAGQVIAARRELGRDAPRATPELDDARTRAHAEPLEPSRDEVVPRSMPEVLFLRREERADVALVGNVERRIVARETERIAHDVDGGAAKRGAATASQPGPFSAVRAAR